jgi:LuxR family maltose regulon positive regulatory protein
MMPRLLEIKFHKPSLPIHFINRPSLVQQLNKGLEFHRWVTLVSAPAGYGKSACISDWIATVDQWQVAWLSLEPSEDDPGRFFNYLIAALQKVDAHLVEGISGLIQAGQLPPAEIISSALINDLQAKSNHIMLVLDDFHVIQDNFILEVIEQVLANFPEQLHLVLITREDPPLPLGRLRANNQLTEIRARDLHFSRPDIDRFFIEVMGHSLTQADIATLEHRTEGWIAGLQLAGLSLRDQSNPSSFIAGFRGSHRFILSYLTEQVLSQQPQEIHRFLLETSILDRLTGDLCDAVTGRSDSSVILEQLFQANLFLVPLDDEREWYRYHHLFADLLRGLLATFHQEQLDELHRRASSWYREVGLVSEAITHALAVRDYTLVVNLLENHAMEMIMEGYAKTVNGWVQSLPGEWISRSPKTNLAFAWTLLLRGEYSQMIQYSDRLQKTFINPSSDDESTLLKAEWLVIQSFVLYMQGKTSACMEIAAEAMDLTPEINNRVWSLAFYVQASVYRLRGDHDMAIKLYQKSIRYCSGTESLFAEIMSTLSLASISFERGQLHLAFETASRVIKRIELTGRLYPICSVLYASIGEIYYQWHQISKAGEYYQKALHLSLLSGSKSITIFCHMLISRLSLSEANFDISEAEIRKAVELLSVDAPEYIHQEIASQQVRVYLALNQLDAAEGVLKSFGLSKSDQLLNFVPQDAASVPARGSISTPMLSLANSYCSVMLNKARLENDSAHLKQLVEATRRVIEWSLSNHLSTVALESLLIRAQANNILGNQVAGQEDYLKAVELGEPEGYIATFLEGGRFVERDLTELVRKEQLTSRTAHYIKRVLAAFNKPGQPGEKAPGESLPIKNEPTSLPEPLSDRELEVLKLMAKGLKYREIGSMLFISQNTVRFHIKSIYTKLQANNRTQALHKAHQLRLL